MNIAEKALQLKQDFDEVYAAGKAAGGGSGDYEQGYEDGKNSVVIVPFDRYLKTATFTSLNMFGKQEVELNFDSITAGFMNLFSIDNADNANTTVEHLTINTPNNITTMQSMLYCNTAGCDYTLKRVTLNFNTQNSGNFQHAFTNQRALETVDGTPLDFSAVTVATRTSAFTNTPSLIDVRFVKESIPLNISFAQSANLSTDTIQSIIDGLADLTGGTAQTLTVHATVGAKLTEAQKATVTAKNWELVY